MFEISQKVTGGTLFQFMIWTTLTDKRYPNLIIPGRRPGFPFSTRVSISAIRIFTHSTRTWRHGNTKSKRSSHISVKWETGSFKGIKTSHIKTWYAIRGQRESVLLTCYKFEISTLSPIFLTKGEMKWSTFQFCKSFSITALLSHNAASAGLVPEGPV